MSISRFPVATFSKNQSSFPAMRGLPTTMQRDMGKSWIFRFFLGQLGAFYFLRNVDPGWSNLFQSPWWRSRNIPPFLRTIYWLAGAILELGRFQAAHRNRWKLSRSKVSSSEGFLWVFFLFTMLGPRMRIVWICFHHVWSFSTWNSSPLFSLCLIFSTMEFITMKLCRHLENMFRFFLTIEEVKLLLFPPQPWFSGKWYVSKMSFKKGNFPLNHTSGRKDKTSRIELVGVPYFVSKKNPCWIMLNIKPQHHSSKKSRGSFSTCMHRCLHWESQSRKWQLGWTYGKWWCSTMRSLNWKREVHCLSFWPFIVFISFHLGVLDLHFLSDVKRTFCWEMFSCFFEVDQRRSC